MRKASKSALVFLIVFSACGARTGFTDVDDSAAEASTIGRDAASEASDARCGARCETGQVCIHQYATHTFDGVLLVSLRKLKSRVMSAIRIVCIR